MRGPAKQQAVARVAVGSWRGSRLHCLFVCTASCLLLRGSLGQRQGLGQVASMHARPSALLAVLALALPLLAAAQGAGAEQGQQVQARVQLQPAGSGGPSETAPLTLQLTAGACSFCAALEVSSGLGSPAVGLALSRVANQFQCCRCSAPALPRLVLPDCRSSPCSSPLLMPHHRRSL